MAPLCPLLGSFGLIYFIVISPILRWLVVFTYRPQFDAGGIFWPKLHNVIITSLLLGQVRKHTHIQGIIYKIYLIYLFSYCIILKPFVINFILLFYEHDTSF